MIPCFKKESRHNSEIFLEDISGRSAVDFGLECTSKNFMYYVHSLRTNLQAASLVKKIQVINYVIIVDTKGSSTAYYYPFLQYLGKRLARGRYSTATEETKAR